VLALVLWLRRIIALRSALRTALALLGFALLVVLQWLGGWLMARAHAPIPGSVVGMVLLAAGIQLGVIPRRLVRGSAELLVRHLTLLYVPAGVGVLLYVALLRREWLPIVAGALASLVTVLAVVGVIADRAERRAHHHRADDGDLDAIADPVPPEEP
jgi:holin-like protein